MSESNTLPGKLSFKYVMPVTLQEGQLIEQSFTVRPGDDSILVEVKILGQYEKVYDGSGDLFTVEEFKQMCEDCNLINYDGHGFAVRQTDNCQLVDTRTPILPSYYETIPEDATHIAWYNR